MQTIGEALGFVFGELSDHNYERSLDFYRFWCGTGQTHLQIPSDQIFDAIWNNRAVWSSIDPRSAQLIHTAANLILRFASDAESDRVLAPYSSGLRDRLCAGSLREFSSNNLMAARYGRDAVGNFYADTNLIAHWVNLGYVDEATIRDHILQSLVSHPKLYDHQADALIILFKLAGPTFEAYADPSVVDRCFELLKGHGYDLPYPGHKPGGSHNAPAFQVKRELVQVSGLRATKRSRWTEDISQEVVALRERGWEGLPPPPVFRTKKSNPAGTNQRDPAATLVATSLGLPNRDRDFDPQVPQPTPPESATTTSGTSKAPEPPATPATHSPSISISTLSDLTIADPSDDESGPTLADTSDNEPPADPTALVPHDTFYLEDGNVEVLCENTLFRVTVSTLSFHSPALRRMFAQTNLASAESPNGCPRIPSSDTAKDFTTLLKMIYLPGYVAPPYTARTYH